MEKMRCILIVDDDEIACFVAERMLEPLDIASEIKSLYNGKEVADYFEEANGNFPDFVLLDINMPLMNGFEFLEWYEKNGFKGTTKFAMYTSSERPADKERAEGYEDVIGYISKPIDKVKIEEVMMRMGQ